MRLERTVLVHRLGLVASPVSSKQLNERQMGTECDTESDMLTTIVEPRQSCVLHLELVLRHRETRL